MFKMWMALNVTSLKNDQENAFTCSSINRETVPGSAEASDNRPEQRSNEETIVLLNNKIILCVLCALTLFL